MIKQKQKRTLAGQSWMPCRWRCGGATRTGGPPGRAWCTTPTPGLSDKTELIKKQGPWKTLADVELATVGYVDWFNTGRLHTAIGVPPAEYEAAYYAQTQPPPETGPNN